MFDVKGNDNSKDTIDAVRHSSTYDTNAINRAIAETPVLSIDQYKC